MATSTATLLQQIDDAITAVSTGAQEYQLPGGQRVRRADLGQLLKMRSQLLAEANGRPKVTLARFQGVR